MPQEAEQLPPLAAAPQNPPVEFHHIKREPFRCIGRIHVVYLGIIDRISTANGFEFRHYQADDISDCGIVFLLNKPNAYIWSVPVLLHWWRSLDKCHLDIKIINALNLLDTMRIQRHIYITIVNPEETYL